MYLLPPYSQSSPRPVAKGHETTPPSCPHQILGLDLAGPDLAILGALLDILYELLLLVLELHALSVQLALRSVQGTLVFAQTLRGRHTLAERPFDDLRVACERQICIVMEYTTHIHDGR